tara:strand:+ start:7733 stop:14215 length:6483 start_codon:yes stop_codon:yes gene_type:complete
MFPSVLSSELKKVAKDSIRTSFHPTTPGFIGLIERFLSDQDQLIKGPYVSVSLPFKQGSDRDWLPKIPLPFPPYSHQEKAFQRLLPGTPKNTLIATGTGSGKTECFLFPILEHCRQQRTKAQRGIKAILVYPMNALATDQAKRIANLISTIPSLSGLRAGLYIGSSDNSSSVTMSHNNIITDKDVLHKSPPDILLTNYKQLDYLLIQPHVQGLWKYNQAGVFRYLVVDEFHTFDGAQGTDLACLIRRLRDRLYCPSDELICVGTSATLGGPDSREAMLEYAGQIFASHFETTSLIEEERLSPEEFFMVHTGFGDPEDGGLFSLPLPGVDDEINLDPENASSCENYIAKQADLWLADTLSPPPEGNINNTRWRLELGWRLGTLPAVHNLVRQAKDTCSINELLERFSKQLGLGVRYPLSYRVLLLESLLALISHARRTTKLISGKEISVPWVNLRQQLWLRELKRMVTSVEVQPQLRYSDDLAGSESTTHLPAVHCRDCGATGWTSTVINQGSNQLNRGNNLRGFYRAFFNRDPYLRYLFPTGNDSRCSHKLCGDCLTFHSTNALESNICPNCQSRNIVAVDIPDCSSQDDNGHPYVNRDCPYCHSKQSLLLIGSSAASLTSTWSSSLFASAFNKDKKLLAFSDSVQDAAHRAGFIAARAYRSSFRTALTRCVQKHGPLALDELQEQLIIYGQEEFINPVDFAATFIPYDLEWLSEWEELQQQDMPTLKADSPLIKVVHNRLRWEVGAEFGYRSRLDSSVEQAGSLTASVDPSVIPNLLPNLQSRLQNEIEPLRHICLSQVHQLVLGLLHHWRQLGGFDMPELVGIDREGSAYITSGGTDTFIFNKYIKHTPKFGPSTPKPSFICSFRRNGSFEQLVREKGLVTWPQHWLERALHPTKVLDGEQHKEALQAVIESLLNEGLLIEIPGHRDSLVWAIPRSRIYVSDQPSLLRCNCCGDTQAIPRDQLSLWDGMPCLVRYCNGAYMPNSRGGLPLYKQLYEKGDVNRIVAREHTGLLPRPDRERLENQYIRGEYRSDPNLLSATSTLEMGINIGDLSTVLLTSVPPEPANYLQRAGRAGRRDGNALVGTLVTGTPHDLFFFSDPKEMLQGQVNPPGCYLDAPAILRRQLMAYTLDRWVISTIDLQHLPRKLKPVLDAVEQSSKNDRKNQAFPYNWMSWVEAKQRDLLESFIGMFNESLTAVSKQVLSEGFLNTTEMPFNSPFATELIQRLEELIAERKRLTGESRRLRAKFNDYKSLGIALTDQQLKDKDQIYREQKAFAALKKDLESKELLAMLTNEGFLPNYSFPEAGVTLKSVLWRHTLNSGRGGNSSEEMTPLSYERPANVAIRELVPNGLFYAQGRRVKVDQIDPNLNQIEQWRFCPSCSFSSRKSDEDFSRKECPRCGNSGYADQGQVNEMAKLKHVQARTEDARSRFGDDSDERKPTFFLRELLILPDLSRRETSLIVNDDDFPFGVEYLSSTSFREINFGQLVAVGQTHTIAGKNLRVRGFEICSSCGKIQQGPASANNHTWSCRFRDKPDEAQLCHLMFIYREFSSEALRFLLPGVNFWDEPGQPSFLGALHLGLKNHFGGKVNHLQSAIGDEPQPDSRQRKTFLYLYDSIPGGSGYLRQLIESGGKDLRSVFKKSLMAMKTCRCSDGCYRCIFQYRQRFDREHTSKIRAIDQLQVILNRWDELQASESSLSEIKINTRAESELELRFIEKLKEGKGLPEGVKHSIRDDVINGRKGYRLILNNGQKSISWTLELQVPIGDEEGVDVFSRADFLLTPTAGGKPVAIYTDGWEYHRGRLAKDAEQRMALQRSDTYLFWALTWDDVVEKLPTVQKPLQPNGLQHISKQMRGVLTREKPFEKWLPSSLLQQIDEQSLIHPISNLDIQCQGSLELLMTYLALPVEEFWQGVAQQFSQSQLENIQISDQRLTNKIEDLNLQGHIAEWKSQNSDKGFFGNVIEPANGLTIINIGDLNLHKKLDPESSFRATHFDPVPSNDSPHQQAIWREWIRQVNLFQFLPHLLITTPGWTGEQQSSSISLSPVRVDRYNVTPADGQLFSSKDLKNWLEISSLISRECRPILDAIQELNRDQSVSLPEAFFELEGKKGEVIAQAELAWPEKKLAVVTQIDDVNAFEQAGWRYWSIDNSPDEIARAIIEAF